MQRVPFGNGVKDQDPAAPTYLLLNSARKIAAFHSINVHKPNGELCPVGKNIWNIGFLGRENGILSIQGFGEDLSLAVLMPIEGKGTQIRRVVNEKDEVVGPGLQKSFQLIGIVASKTSADFFHINMASLF